MLIHEYFDKIYLLNLHKRKQRLERSLDKLSQVGINPDIFHGCDGRVLRHIWGKLENNYFTNPQYVGCSISHLSIYQEALELGYNKILIIEDDNLVHKNIQEYFNSFDIPDFWNLLYLGYIPLNNDQTIWDYGFGYNSTNAINTNFFRAHNLWGLFSYGITAGLMQEVLDVYNNSFPMEIDRYLVNHIQPRAVAIASAPQLFCCDDDILSDNTGHTLHLSTKSIDQRFSTRNDYI